MRENSKTSKYRDFAESQGDTFTPFAIESYGGLGEKALDLVMEIREERVEKVARVAKVVGAAGQGGQGY